MNCLSIGRRPTLGHRGLQGCPAVTLDQQGAPFRCCDQALGQELASPSNRNLLFTRQERIVHGVLLGAVLAAHVGRVVQPVRSRRAG